MGKGVARAYLGSLAINENVVKSIIKLHSEGDYDSNPGPLLWYSDIDEEAFIETPLHIIFHGIVDDIMEEIKKVLKDENKNKPFEDQENVFLEQLVGLRLSWCKIKNFPKSNG